MSSIFISHSSRDGTIAAEIRHRLEKQGHTSVFLDFDPADGIPAGRNWEQELYTRLRACRAVIVICSAASMASDWVFAEITHAKALGKHVFPVRVAPCEVRALLAEFQVIELADDLEEGYSRLWRGLRLAGLDPKNLFDWDGTRPPYPGLLAFQEEDTAIFFGRAAEIGEGLGLLQRLRRFGGSSWALILGASGSGKSSLMRAGLLPRLRRDRETWCVVGPFRPRARPFEELSRALAQAFAETSDPSLSSSSHDTRTARSISNTLCPTPSEARPGALVDLLEDLKRQAGRPEAGVLLVIDQLEEILRSREGDEGRRFLSFLRAASETRRSPLTLLATLRSDFLGDFQSHPALRELSFASLSVGPLSVEGFTQVIEGPAALAGLELESGLAAAMVADTETDDALPLLAFTLRELWQSHGERGRLTLGDYRDRLGGLHGSIARAAETALTPRALSPAQEADLRTAFLALVRVNEEGQYVRQSARWRRLPAGCHDVLNRFVAARLLISHGDGGERRLEVAHEALLRVWDRLVAWLEVDRAFLLWRKRLRQSKEQWEQKGSARGYLLRGPALGEAVGWLTARGSLLPTGERAYIRSSAQADRRRRYGVTALLVAVAAALAVFGFRAETQRRRAEQLVASGTDTTQLIVARRFRQMAQLLPFTAPMMLDRSARTFVEIDHPELFVNSVNVELEPARILHMSPDLMAVALSSDGGVEIKSVLDGRWTVHLAHEAKVYRAAVEGAPPETLGWLGEPRGRYVLTAAEDGAVRLFRLPSFEPLAAAIMERPDLREVERLLASSGDGAPPFHGEPTVAYAGHDDRVSRMAFSPDGSYAVTTAGTDVAIWKTDSGAQPVLLAGHDEPVTWAAFSPDSRRIVTTSTDRRALIWDLQDPFTAPLALTGHKAGVVAAAFDAEGHRVLTAAGDREIRQWSVTDGKGTAVATLDCDPIELKYTGTAGYAVIACTNGTARILNVGSGQTQVLQ